MIARGALRSLPPCRSCLHHRPCLSRAMIPPRLGESSRAALLPPVAHRTVPTFVRGVSWTAVRPAAKLLDRSASGGKKLAMEEFPPERIRNLSIIAHIDHGKSTLADRLLQMTGTLPETSSPQFLDKLKVERERGITVKAQTVSIIHTHTDGHRYLINLIDTPGHVDFSYEVSRSLGACEGGLLLVDCTQGIQAQTLSVFHHAQEANLKLLPVINKVDLPHASPEETSAEIESSLGLKEGDHMHISAKTGLGVEAVLGNIIDKLPPPKERIEADGKLRALVFDTFYDQFRGVVSLVRIFGGSLRRGDKVRFLQADRKYDILEVGIYNPDEVPVDVLQEGQVGYLVCNMKNSDEAHIGDTVCWADRPVDPLPGFKPMKAMVYAGVFPVDSGEFSRLEEAIERLTLNDRSVSVQRESSAALSQGFRLGFLGTLHMDVFRQRLEDEYESNVIITAPTVPYKVIYRDGREEFISNPAEFPEVYDPKMRVASVEEPMVNATIFVPNDYIGEMMELCARYRGVQQEYRVLDGSDRAILRYQFPLSEIVTDFFSELKSASSGFASFDYEEAGYHASDLVKLNMMLNSKPVDALAMIVHKDAAQSIGRVWTKKLREVLPRQLFEVAIQAAIGSRVLARETLSAVRKDVTAGLYGGHYERKMKHLNKQKEGKKRLKRLAGNIEVPQSAFFQVLSSRPRAYSTAAVRTRTQVQEIQPPQRRARRKTMATEDLLEVLPKDVPSWPRPLPDFEPPSSFTPFRPQPISPVTRSQAFSKMCVLNERDDPDSASELLATFTSLYLSAPEGRMFSPQELTAFIGYIARTLRNWPGEKRKYREAILTAYEELREVVSGDAPTRGIEMAILTAPRFRRVPSLQELEEYNKMHHRLFAIPPSPKNAKRWHAYHASLNHGLYLTALAGNERKFEKWWTRLNADGFEIDQWAILARMILLQKLGRTDGVLLTLERFQGKETVTSPIVLINYAMWCLAKRGRWGAVRSLYGQIRPGEPFIKDTEELVLDLQHRPAPSRITYSSLVHALAFSGRLKPALVVLKHMLESGFSPGVPDYVALFEGFARYGEVPSSTPEGEASAHFPPVVEVERKKSRIASIWQKGTFVDDEHPPTSHFGAGLKDAPTTAWTRAALEEVWDAFLAVSPSEDRSYAPTPRGIWTALFAWSRVTNGDSGVVQRRWREMERKFTKENGWIGWREDTRLWRLRGNLGYGNHQDP